VHDETDKRTVPVPVLARSLGLDVRAMVGRRFIGAEDVPQRPGGCTRKPAQPAHAVIMPARSTFSNQARDLAPRWPYPVYDAAFSYLQLDEPAMAEELYECVDQMAPRGYFTCKASLDTLRRERAGELFPGFARAYAATEWIDAQKKKRLLAGIVAKFPEFALAWKDLSKLLDDEDRRLHAIEQGLRGRPDPETRGILLVNKANILAGNGDRGAAIAILGELALSPDSTLAAEHLAKASLARLVASA
jgi:hypothetical protein